jgi:hypothetical protein
MLAAPLNRELNAMPRKTPTDEELDRELEDTFPASDPPGLTEPRGEARRREREAEERRDEADEPDEADDDSGHA